jgi:hypothetical protein
MGKEQLLRQIEELRCRLYTLVKGRELSDPEVVIVSQELDCLLNWYHRTNVA